MAREGELVTETIHVADMEKVRAFLGHRDRHLRMLRDTFGIRTIMRGHTLSLEGDAASVQTAARVVRDLLAGLTDSSHLSAAEVESAIAAAYDVGETDVEFRLDVFSPGRTIRPRTAGQAAYLRAIAENDLVFCVGPAGSGKTYLAVAMAVAALKRDAVRKIVLTRPAVEAGERLGFLPGDLQAKVDPYLRPLYDALHDMMPTEQIQRYMENDIIEVVPLAFMRGRTLDRAFIILDEGQNCTGRQMRMFLTRLGASSTSVVTGDVSQTDLPPGDTSGMIEAMNLLRDIKGIGFIRLTQRDIIRHRLVQDIVDAYEERDNRQHGARHTEGPG
jgi:phosphate starvation-inducible PhoH-like protein